MGIISLYNLHWIHWTAQQNIILRSCVFPLVSDHPSFGPSPHAAPQKNINLQDVRFLVLWLGLSQRSCWRDRGEIVRLFKTRPVIPGAKTCAAGLQGCWGEADSSHQTVWGLWLAERASERRNKFSDKQGTAVASRLLIEYWLYFGNVGTAQWGWVEYKQLNRFYMRAEGSAVLGQI